MTSKIQSLNNVKYVYRICLKVDSKVALVLILINLFVHVITKV